MNPNFAWLWMGGVFGAVTITAFVVLHTTAMWWKERRLQSVSPGTLGETRDEDAMNHRVLYPLLAVIGFIVAFLLVKDTAVSLLSVCGIFTVIPYAFLQRKRIEAKRWDTRISVSHSLDEIQIPAVSRQSANLLDAYPWLEQLLKQNTIFQKIEARFVDLIAQGQAVRGSSVEWERIAHQTGSEDLIQFIPRLKLKSEVNDQTGILLRAAEEIARRIRLDAELVMSQITGQAIWLWVGVIVIFLVAVLIPLGAP
jgi:hypothetical protein